SALRKRRREGHRPEVPVRGAARSGGIAECGAGALGLAARRHRAFARGPRHREQPLARRDEHLHPARALRGLGGRMKSVRMLSTGAYLPGDPITNEQMAALVGPVPDDVLEGIQVKTRHWIVDTATGDHRESNVDMAVKAARQALDRAGLSADEVDFIGVSTASPAQLLPPSATFVQDRLGLPKRATLVVRSGRAGAVE